MLSPGRGNLRQGVLRKELTWQVGGTAGRPACLRILSRGMWRELVSEQWAVSPEVRWKPWMVQSRGGCGILKIPLTVTGEVTAEVVTRLSKAEKAEVWAQARVSVSRAAVIKHCKLGDFKQQKYILFS